MFTLDFSICKIFLGHKIAGKDLDTLAFQSSPVKLQLECLISLFEFWVVFAKFLRKYADTEIKCEQA
jgi:hypothetical protein